MLQSAAPNPQADAAGRLEEATDQAIAACAGDARGAVKALIVANGYLERKCESYGRLFRAATRAANSNRSRETARIGTIELRRGTWPK